MRLEAVVWTSGLAVLAIWGADLHGHVTFCLPTALGSDACMGCGVGHAAGLALRGDLAASWAEHPMGIPAVIVLLTRIVYLTFSSPMFVGGLHGKRLPVSAGS
jgi:hypothetical protein